VSVLVVGSVALDTVETPFGRREDVLGGSALYFSVAASFFNKVQLVAVVGTDFPDEGFRLLEKHSIDLTGLQQVSGKTFRWSGKYHLDINHRDTLDTQLNVFESFTPDIPEDYKNASHLFLANIHPALQLEVLSQVKKPDLVVADTMNLWIDSNADELLQVIAQTDLFLLSDSEARQLTGEPNLLKAARHLLDRGPEHVIIKKGEHGAMLVNSTGVFYAPGFPLEDIVDPTGAGDVFAGGAVGYLSGLQSVSDISLRKAIIYGSTLASYNVESFGMERLSSLTRDDIEQRFRQFKKLTSFEAN